MAGLLGLVGLLLLSACVLVVALLVQLLGRSAGAHGAHDPAVHRAVRRSQRRLAGCAALAGLVLIGGFALNAARPGWLGLPVAIAPGCAAAVGLLGFALWPSTSTDQGGSSSASLVRREPWSYGSRRVLLGPVGIAAAFLCFLSGSAAIASPDDHGLMRAFTQTQAELSSTATPFPGSFYGVPLALVTLVLGSATYAALRRMATSPTILPAAASHQDRLDRRWRQNLTRVIVGISTVSLLIYAGGTLAIAGSAMRRASEFSINGGQDTIWYAVGWASIGVGLVAVLAAAVIAGVVGASVLSFRGQTMGAASVPADQLG